MHELLALAQDSVQSGGNAPVDALDAVWAAAGALVASLIAWLRGRRKS